MPTPILKLQQLRPGPYWALSTVDTYPPQTWRFDSFAEAKAAVGPIHFQLNYKRLGNMDITYINPELWNQALADILYLQAKAEAVIGIRPEEMGPNYDPNPRTHK